MKKNVLKIYIICLILFPDLISAQQGQILHNTGQGLLVKSTSTFSTIDVDAANGDAAFRVVKNGAIQWVIHSDALNGALSFTEFSQPTGLTIAKSTGNVHVRGNLSKGGGSFKIDHPLDPENKYLYHSFVESPDMMNVYNGNTVTDENGTSTVQLPNYFSALNRDFRYQLTVIGAFANAIISKEVSENQFEIATDLPNVKVSWQITGIRQDPYANMNRIPNTVVKEAQNRGKFLHPAAYGKSNLQAESMVQNISSQNAKTEATSQLKGGH